MEKLETPMRIVCPNPECKYAWFTRSTHKWIQCPKSMDRVRNPAYMKKETRNNE